jgi:hypothetical protein
MSTADTEIKVCAIFHYISRNLNLLASILLKSKGFYSAAFFYNCYFLKLLFDLLVYRWTPLNVNCLSATSYCLKQFGSLFQERKKESYIVHLMFRYLFTYLFTYNISYLFTCNTSYLFTFNMSYTFIEFYLLPIFHWII